jgi:hypothetical protein
MVLLSREIVVIPEGNRIADVRAVACRYADWADPAVIFEIPFGNIVLHGNNLCYWGQLTAANNVIAELLQYHQSHMGIT